MTKQVKSVDFNFKNGFVHNARFSVILIAKQMKLSILKDKFLPHKQNTFCWFLAQGRLKEFAVRS